MLARPGRRRAHRSWRRSAKVAHRETIATGERPVTAVGTRRASRQDLQRRHQLLVVATGWGRRYTIIDAERCSLVMDTMEFAVALLGRDTDRAGAIVGSWRWLFDNRDASASDAASATRSGALRRATCTASRSAAPSRLKRFFVTAGARGPRPGPRHPARGRARRTAEPGRTSPTGWASPRPSPRARSSTRSPRAAARTAPTPRRASSPRFRSQATAILVVAVLWLIGSRNLVAMHLPLIGRLAPLDSWWTTWRHFFASWSPNGVGTGPPGMPGYGVLGVRRAPSSSVAWGSCREWR